MHFIVTGGAGFIGSHITEQLLSSGHQVTVVDNLTTGNLHNLQPHSQLEFLQQDISLCQPEDFAQPIDGIVHLAATPSISVSWSQPLAAHHNNLSTTIAVIELCQALHIPRLVFASSAAVYGNPSKIPIREEQPTTPISPYGVQKLASEQYATLFARQFGFTFVGLRLFNVFGARQVPNSPYSGVISNFTNAMKENLPLTIYGDGTQTRDFIHVRDVAISKRSASRCAFERALTITLNDGASLICNLGTGQSTSIIELVKLLKVDFPQWRSQINFTSYRRGEIKHSQADISLARYYLDFQPKAIAPLSSPHH